MSTMLWVDHELSSFNQGFYTLKELYVSLHDTLIASREIDKTNCKNFSIIGILA